GLTLTDTREPHPNRPPAFSLAAQGAKKKLGKKKRRQGISPLRRREGVRRLHSRELLKKLDQNFKARQNRRLNADLFEKD
ncbi:MAG: hypothetical protein II297_01135, partial [Clostridia bacterium]|nr:hypothetical protein [Clostridia bacterium]